MADAGRAAISTLANALALYDLERDAPDGDAPALRPRVLRQIDRARAPFRSRVGRLWAAQSIEGLAYAFVEDVLRTAADDGDDAALTATCFRAVEALRARTLLDALHATPVRAFPSAEHAAAAAARERDVLRFAPGTAASHALEDYELGSRLPIGHPELLPDVETLFAEADAGFDGSAEPASLADVQAALRADELLIAYCLPAPPVRPPRELWAIVVVHDAARVVRLLELPAPGSTTMRLAVDGQAPVDFFGLNDAVVQLRRGVQEDDDLSAERLARMHDVLVGTLTEALRDTAIDPSAYRHWVVVPDGVLHGVPFAALRDADGRHLGTDRALSIVPSASAWLALQRAPRPLDRLLGFANPAVAGLAPLPDAEEELAGVCRLLRNRGVPCTAYTGAAATAARLQREAPGFGMLHVATHGERATEQALDFQALLLAPGDGDDGRVEARELRALDLRATALAVLSVCDSGTYRFGPGNELHGLVAALLSAGARDVVATLWPIDDAMGRRFVARFYAYVLAHGAAEALRRARADLVAQGAAVRDWSAFVVVGPGRAPVVDRARDG